MTHLVTIDHLSLIVRKQVILKDVCLQLKKGECLAIVGSSGSGKSSLALAILGLMKANSGTITFHVNPKTPKAKVIQMIWQDISSSLNPTMNVRELILEPLNILGMQQSKEKLYQVLELVNLPRSVLPLKPHKLSGGQKQCVAIAKALICEPDLLICDEPLSALDTLNRSLILKLFQTIKQEYKSTLLFITHDMSATYYLADTIAVMHQGMIVEYSTKEKIFQTPEHKKTQELLDAIPSFSLEYTDPTMDFEKNYVLV
ncbi:Oligopeptide transport ATP-binding protein OppF [Chlamydia avium]|nr:ABC transporter ATP-binding protein [Chlamydia avium]EPP36671.1 ABC transporter family protein [Chlamydia psittaci 10_743_SC13]EPP38312.1 ABC transporter family protein [Chlamydia avium]VVT42853.1 Oligopeptide transport ATP-binding protein OppF [Chlamydia avium]